MCTLEELQSQNNIEHKSIIDSVNSVREDVNNLGKKIDVASTVSASLKWFAKISLTVITLLLTIITYVQIHAISCENKTLKVQEKLLVNNYLYIQKIDSVNKKLYNQKTNIIWLVDTVGNTSIRIWDFYRKEFVPLRERVNKLDNKIKTEGIF